MNKNLRVTKSSEGVGSGAPALRKNAGRVVEKRGDEDINKVRFGNPREYMKRVFPGLPNELWIRFWIHEKNQKQLIPWNIPLTIENPEARAFQDATRIATGAKRGEVREGVVDGGFNTKFKYVSLSKFPGSFTEGMEKVGFVPTELIRTKREQKDTIEIVTIRFKRNGRKNEEIARDVEQLTSLGANQVDYWENPKETKLEDGRPRITRVDTLNLKFIVGQKKAKNLPVLSPRNLFALARLPMSA